jgi:hypothetical protein
MINMADTRLDRQRRTPGPPKALHADIQKNGVELKLASFYHILPPYSHPKVNLYKIESLIPIHRLLLSVFS